MPIRPENRCRYPADWPAISHRIRFERAGGRCEWCGAENYAPHPVTLSRVILTVAHIDHVPENCAESNLAALCQRCHLNHDRPNHIRNRRRNARLHTLDLFREAGP